MWYVGDASEPHCYCTRTMSILGLLAPVSIRPSARFDVWSEAASNSFGTAEIAQSNRHAQYPPSEFQRHCSRHRAMLFQLRTLETRRQAGSICPYSYSIARPPCSRDVSIDIVSRRRKRPSTPMNMPPALASMATRLSFEPASFHAPTATGV
jgi:hypothetical protein